MRGFAFDTRDLQSRGFRRTVTVRDNHYLCTHIYYRTCTGRMQVCGVPYGTIRTINAHKIINNLVPHNNIIICEQLFLLLTAREIACGHLQSQQGRNPVNFWPMLSAFQDKEGGPFMILVRA